MKALTIIVPFAAAAILATGPAAHAQVIDFETTPDGSTPVDDAPLDRTATYEIDGVGVSLGFDTNGDGVADTDAIFERRGTDGQDGFAAHFGPGDFDTERASSPRRLGTFFLRQQAAIGGWAGPLVITYDAAVDRFGGEIWDLDSLSTGETERWRIIAFDGAGVPVAVAESPDSLPQTDPDSLDSLAWVFSLQAPGQIRRIEIDFIGTKTSGIGLAFNNFSPATATALGIEREPQNVVFDHPGGDAMFTVLAVGAGDLTYQWRHDGEPLSDGPGVSGATTDALTISADGSDIGEYDVVVSNDFGQVTSDPAVLAIRENSCPADFDGDGSLTIFDFLAFQNAFDAGCP